MAYGETSVVKVVAVEGGVRDWAAYVGPGEWSDEKVKQNGFKVMEQTAVDLFRRMVDQGGARFCQLDWRQ